MWCRRPAQIPNCTSSGCIQGCGVAATREDGLSRLFYLYGYPKQSIIGHQHRLRHIWTALDKIWRSNVVPAASPNCTSSGHIIRGCGVAATREDGLSRLIYLCYYPKQSIIGHQHRLRRMWAALDMIWRSNVVPAASPNRTSSGHIIRGCVVAATREDGLSRFIYLCYYPKQSIIGHQHRLRRMWTELDTIW